MQQPSHGRYFLHKMAVLACKTEAGKGSVELRWERLFHQPRRTNSPAVFFHVQCAVYGPPVARRAVCMALLAITLPGWQAGLVAHAHPSDCCTHAVLGWNDAAETLGWGKAQGR